MTTLYDRAQRKLAELREADRRAREVLERVRAELSDYAMRTSGVAVEKWGDAGYSVSHLGTETLCVEVDLVEGTGAISVFGPEPEGGEDDDAAVGTLLTQDVEEAIDFMAGVLARSAHMGGAVVVRVPAA